MLTDKAGKIAEGLYLLGEKICLMYLVRGRQSMLVGGGMNWIAPKLEEQLREFNVEPNEIKYIVIPHPHFDHCGAVPYLKRKYPQAKVLASEAAKTILAKPKVVEYIELVNLLMIEAYGLKEHYDKLNLKIDAIPVDEAVNNSTEIDLGNGLKVHFIESPGHSPGDVAVYIPALKALFPSDAVPCPLGSIDKLARPSPQHDFVRFKESLKRLAAYDVEICGFDHYAAVTGADAKQVLLDDVKMTEEYGKRIVDLYSNMKDLEQVAHLVAKETLEVDQFDFLNEELMMPVARAEVRNILKASGIATN
jgi:2-aminobenzoylacetyl-CoA thioesterase